MWTADILTVSSVLETTDLIIIIGGTEMSTAMKTEVLMTLDLIITPEGTGMSTAMKTGAMMAGVMTITEERTTEMANGVHPGISQY